MTSLSQEKRAINNSISSSAMLKVEFYSSVILSAPLQICIFSSNEDTLSWTPTPQSQNSRPTTCTSRSDSLRSVTTSPVAQDVQKSPRSATSRYLGTFLSYARYPSSLPADATQQLFAHLMRERYGLLVIVQPELAMQVVQKMNLPKKSVVITYPFTVLVNNCATMRREVLFKDAERFYPERHLFTDPADPYFVPKDATI